MRDGVVLHPGPRHPEAAGEPGSLDEGREPRVERVDDVALEGEPLAIAPQRGRRGGDGRAVGRRAGGTVDGVQGAETLPADRDRRGRVAGAAVPAAQRSGARGGGGGRRRGGGERRGHRFTNKKARATNAAGGRFLAPCLTWRQYAATHHESSVVDGNISRGLRRRKDSSSHAALPGRVGRDPPCACLDTHRGAV